MNSLFDSIKREEIISRIDKLTPENKALWGRMNVSQMLCHCADTLKMATGERPVADKSSFAKRALLKPLILYVLPIPKGVPTASELDQAREGTSPTDFETDRKDLLSLIERICSLRQDFTWAAHPAFGKMNYKQWGLLAHKHIDHHLKQFGV